MDIFHLLESLPIYELTKRTDAPPQNAFPFSGHPRKHPVEKHKLLLIHDPMGESPSVVEFNLNDIVYIENLHALITESGESLRLVKLWIQKGARGVILEPFEVDEPIIFSDKTQEIREKFLAAGKNL
jgi:inorganic pyrophosphatase